MKGLVFQDVDIKSGNHKMFCGVKHLMGGFMDDAQDVDIKSGNHKMFCGVKHLMGGFMDDAWSEIIVVAIDTIGYFL